VELTLKQKAFADYYIETGNAAESYKRAYKNKCSDNSARANGNKILTKDYVKNYIDERLTQLESERIAKGDEVLQYLTRVMRGKETEQVVVTENIGDFMSEAKIIDKQLSAKDRIKAAELLGKRYRLFIDKVESDISQRVIFEGEDGLED